MNNFSLLAANRLTHLKVVMLAFACVTLIPCPQRFDTRLLNRTIAALALPHPCRANQASVQSGFRTLYRRRRMARHSAAPGWVGLRPATAATASRALIRFAT
jgi:hypothetical protein